jgi:hypothetical protein
MVGAGSDVDKAVADFVTSPAFGRLLLEVGGGVAGAYLTGGASVPLSTARVAAIAQTFLKQLAIRSAGGWGWRSCRFCSCNNNHRSKR